MDYSVNAAQMKLIDKKTIEDIGIPSVVLMERAACAVVQEIEKLPGRKVLAVCGTGNNGADAVAAARILFLRGYEVSILLPMLDGNGEICSGAGVSDEMKCQLSIARKLKLHICNNADFSEYSIIIDGIFGIGIRRNIEGIYADVIRKINETEAKIVSVDIPSGISADNGKILGCAVRADITVTFGLVKNGLLLYPGADYTGRLVVADIGFPKQVIDEVAPNCFTITKTAPDKLLPKRRNDSNKGTYGKALIVAGSDEMTGAAYLCAKAAYRMGTGLVEVLTTPKAAEIIRNNLPEAICTVRNNETININKATVIAVGPGLGKSEKAALLLDEVIKNCNVPLVLDADALNILSERMDFLGLAGIKSRISYLQELLPKGTILTPHVKELSRLLGISVNELKAGLFDIAYEMTYNTKLIFVCKDARTIVAYDNYRYINQSGNNGMAKGGSGDVLTGIITGLIAGGYDCVEAAVKGVYLHGCFGDKAAEKLGQHAMLAGDILDSITD